ncbi:Shiga toxin A subunit, partial [Salmonella enterica]|nr:Shiga toxin A subunit [Salmonella enterica]
MVCLLVGVPAISYAHDYGCATVGASMDSSLFDAIKNDLNIDVATIIKDKTKVEILDISPVSKVYAESLARMDYEKDKAKNKVAILDKKSYFDSYYENQVKSIVAKYTYINKDKEKDIFIASSFMNADE